MGSPTQSEELSVYEIIEDLDQTSHLSDANLKPLLEALQKAKQDEARANPDHAVTQKIEPKVIAGLLEQVKTPKVSPAVASVTPKRAEAALTLSAEKFNKALSTVPASMRDRVTDAFEKAKAGLEGSVPQAFAAETIARELARAITDGRLMSMLERMRDPAFAATVTAAYQKELAAPSQ